MFKYVFIYHKRNRFSVFLFLLKFNETQLNFEYIYNKCKMDSDYIILRLYYDWLLHHDTN